MHLEQNLTGFFKLSLCLPISLTHLKRVPVFGYRLHVKFFRKKLIV